MEALIIIALLAWAAMLLWSGRSSKLDKRQAEFYSRTFTPEELEQIDRNLDGTRKS